MDFEVSMEHSENFKKPKKIDKFLHLARAEKAVENGYTNNSWHTRNDPQRLGKRSSSRENTDHTISKIDKNNEKSPGYLKLVVTQTPVKTQKE